MLKVKSYFWIDLECQKYLDNNKLELESKEKAVLQQQEMIDEVDSFQKKCLAYLKTEQNHQINFEEFEKFRFGYHQNTGSKNISDWQS